MLSTVRVSIVVVMLAFSVCSNGVCSPVTSTVVDVVPTSSVRFTVEFCPSWTLILRVEVLKPSLLIVSVYSPGLSREYWYAPVADVVALNDSPVAELFNARLAPAIAAPDGSVTVPLMPPVTMVCAFAPPQMARNISRHRNKSLKYRIDFCSPSICILGPCTRRAHSSRLFAIARFVARITRPRQPAQLHFRVRVKTPVHALLRP